MATKTQSPPRWLEWLVVVLVVILAGVVRLVNLSENPGWYPDEGSWMELTRHTLDGHTQYMVFDGSVLITVKMPVFRFLLAGAALIGGESIGTLRTLTGSLGVLTVGLLYVVLRLIEQSRSGGHTRTWFPALAAFMLAVYPKAVTYTRMGFSYSLLTPLVLLLVLGLWFYLDGGNRRWLVVAALAMGIGTVSDVMILTLIPPVAIIISTRRWRDLLWSLPLMALPFAIYTLIGTLLWGDDFLFDLNFLLFRVGEIPPIAIPALIPLNFFAVFSTDPWFAPALAGLFLLQPARLRRLCLALYILALAGVARTVSLSEIAHYYISPLTPFVAIGMAAFAWYALPVALTVCREGFETLFARWHWLPDSHPWLRTRSLNLGTALGVFLVVISPFLMTGWTAVYRATHDFTTPVDAIITDPDDARAAAAYINANIQPDDVVITSPVIAWLIDGHVADFQMALAADGRPTKHFPDDIPARRFSFDARFSNARFVIIDNMWRNWAVLNIEDLEDIIDEIEDGGSWPLVFESGDVSVYRNPAR
ncbi:MAG: glycosyltransferase family 39 protein [Anaerolineae bacterium]|nr:glycosyltransferase family 39 protein [Anaerolineae bacterium]